MTGVAGMSKDAAGLPPAPRPAPAPAPRASAPASPLPSVAGLASQAARTMRWAVAQMGCPTAPASMPFVMAASVGDVPCVVTDRQHGVAMDRRHSVATDRRQGYAGGSGAAVRWQHGSLWCRACPARHPTHAGMQASAHLQHDVGACQPLLPRSPALDVKV